MEQVEAKVLTTNEEKMHIFEQIGIDYLVECPFTREIMCMEPEDFIAKIVHQLHVKCFVVGSDFHFGHNRRGDYHMLKDLSDKYGYEVLVINKMQEDKRYQQHLSGKRLQRAILKGKSSVRVSLFCDRGDPSRKTFRQHETWNPDDQPDSAGGKTASGEWCLCDRSAAWRPELPWRYKRWGETDD